MNGVWWMANEYEFFYIFVYATIERTSNHPLRNITLSARGDLIDQARRVAMDRGITLNNAF